MKHRFKKIIKEARGVSLSSEEKGSIKTSLLKHIENNPLVESSGSFSMPKHVSYIEWVGSYFNNKKIMVPSALAFLILVTTGTGLVSANALPGNFLYPVKILKEKINLALTIDPEEKIKLLTQNADTRLVEAETLSSLGRLDENTEAHLAQSFEDDSVRVSLSVEHIKRQDQNNNNQTISQFKDSLWKHQKIVGSLNMDSKIASSSRLEMVINNMISKFNSQDNSSSATTSKKDRHREARSNFFNQTFFKSPEHQKEDDKLIVSSLSSTTLVASTTASSTVVVPNFEDARILYRGPEILKKPEITTSTFLQQNTINTSGARIQTNLNTRIHILGIPGLR